MDKPSLRGKHYRCQKDPQSKLGSWLLVDNHINQAVAGPYSVPPIELMQIIDKATESARRRLAAEGENPALWEAIKAARQEG